MTYWRLGPFSSCLPSMWLVESAPSPCIRRCLDRRGVEEVWTGRHTVTDGRHKDLGLHFTWITNTAIMPDYDVTMVMVTGFQQTVSRYWFWYTTVLTSLLASLANKKKPSRKSFILKNGFYTVVLIQLFISAEHSAGINNVIPYWCQRVVPFHFLFLDEYHRSLCRFGFSCGGTCPIPLHQLCLHQHNTSVLNTHTESANKRVDWFMANAIFGAIQTAHKTISINNLMLNVQPVTTSHWYFKRIKLLLLLSYDYVLSQFHN